MWGSPRRPQVRGAGPALISSAAGLLVAYAAPAVSVLPYGHLFFTEVRRPGAEDAVALTFDERPDLGLEAFLRLLEDYRARATFFVLGEQVERDPGRLREILVRGHEVAVYCCRHRNHLRLSPHQALADMRLPGQRHHRGGVRAQHPALQAAARRV